MKQILDAHGLMVFLEKEPENENFAWHQRIEKNRLRLRYPFPQYPNSPLPQFTQRCNLRNLWLSCQSENFLAENKRNKIEVDGFPGCFF